MTSENRRDSSSSESRSRSSSTVNTNSGRIRCYKCKEYDYFARECHNAFTDEDSEHGNLDQEALQMLTQENLISANVNVQVDCLNM